MGLPATMGRRGGKQPEKRNKFRRDLSHTAGEGGEEPGIGDFRCPAGHEGI